MHDICLLLLAISPNRMAGVVRTILIDSYLPQALKRCRIKRYTIKKDAPAFHQFPISNQINHFSLMNVFHFSDHQSSRHLLFLHRLQLTFRKFFNRRSTHCIALHERYSSTHRSQSIFLSSPFFQQISLLACCIDPFYHPFNSR